MGSQLAGCAREAVEEADRSGDVAEIVVEPVQLTMEAGGQAWLAAQANDAGGQPVGGAELRFSQADAHVLSVTQQGLVTSLGPATDQTHVRVTSGDAERQVPVVVVPGPPQRMEKLSGDGQEAVAGQPSAEPLVARLVDAWGNPLAGVPVTIKSATELFPPGETVTAPDGTMSFDVPRLTTAGTVVVVVTVDGGPGPVESFQFRVLPGAPSGISVAGVAATDTTRPDGPRAVDLRVVDSFGNAVPDVEVVALFAGAEAPVQVRTDAAGSALVFLPPAAGQGPVPLEVTLPGVPGFSRTLAVDPDQPPAPGEAGQGT